MIKNKTDNNETIYKSLKEQSVQNQEKLEAKIDDVEKSLKNTERKNSDLTGKIGNVKEKQNHIAERISETEEDQKELEHKVIVQNLNHLRKNTELEQNDDKIEAKVDNINDHNGKVDKKVNEIECEQKSKAKKLK
jgi:predicted  nucleic acid-binding Zn-ribbon protein